MPRPRRSDIHGYAFHVFNRGHEKRDLFLHSDDYRFFLALLRDAPRGPEIPLLAYCLLPNHWHLVVMPRDVSALSAYLQWVTGRHGLQWRRAHGPAAPGRVYQGRFKSVPIVTDRHLFTALRYVEANPVRAGLVARARDWPWSSRAQCPDSQPPLAAWPWPVPTGWDALLDSRQPPEQVEAVRHSLKRGRSNEFLDAGGPCGDGSSEIPFSIGAWLSGRS